MRIRGSLRESRKNDSRVRIEALLERRRGGRQDTQDLHGEGVGVDIGKSDGAWDMDADTKRVVWVNAPDGAFSGFCGGINGFANSCRNPWVHVPDLRRMGRMP